MRWKQQCTRSRFAAWRLTDHLNMMTPFNRFRRKSLCASNAPCIPLDGKFDEIDVPSFAALMTLALCPYSSASAEAPVTLAEPVLDRPTGG